MQDLYPSRLEDENIINRVDPVVYSKKMITEHSLNKEQLDSYERNGFIVFPKLFSKDEIKAFKEELKSLESNIELRKKDEFISEPDSNELRTIFNQHLYSKLFDKLSKDPRILDKVRQILGSDVYIHHGRINIKHAYKENLFLGIVILKHGIVKMDYQDVDVCQLG